MSQTITISPLTRIEGHARISIQLDDDGRVHQARLQVQEFRGFEAFCIGRPFWEMPNITARICGICPVSHALAAAQAGERIFGLVPPAAARRLRSLLSLSQLILSHSLSFFHLSAPDIVLGLDFDPAERNIVGLARHRPEIIRKGIRLRQIGQEIVNRIGGGNLHPEHIVAGGMREPLSPADRDDIAGLLPEAQQLVRFASEVWEERWQCFLAEMEGCDESQGLSLGLIDGDGNLDHLTGRLRFVDNSGVQIEELAAEDFGDAIRETIAGDSYMKPTECLVARLFFLEDRQLSSSALGYHQARLIEMMYAVERMSGMLDEPSICDPHVLARGGVNYYDGVGVTEAPRGTLIHHYQVDRHGLLTGVNLIVATGHNSRAMDRTITDIARRHLRGDRLTEGLLNRVEHGIRLYDPCLSCATHLHGRLGMEIELLASDGNLLERSMI
jgi:NAD-reducing hydrogenase large subunit